MAAALPATIFPRKSSGFLLLSPVPIYEYRCPNDHTFELFQKMSDPPPAACEVCGEGPVTKVLYPAAIHFKGSGFYSTDYGRGSRQSDAAKAEGRSKDGGAGGGDSKPSEKKSEPKKAAEA